GWGWTAEKIGDSTQAVQCYQKVLQLGPEPQDQVIAQKRLVRLGVSLPDPGTGPAPVTTPTTKKNWRQIDLGLEIEGGVDDNLNVSSVLSKMNNVPLQDGFADLGVRFGFLSAP